MNWSKSDIEKLKLNHNLTDSGIKKASKIPKKENISVEKETIKKVLWVMHREKTIPDYVEEFKFHPVRKFRFDWAIPVLKIGIEYEGLISKKSRHTTITGYSNDCMKYNLATIAGWKILRYTAKNYMNLSTDLKKIIENTI